MTRHSASFLFVLADLSLPQSLSADQETADWRGFQAGSHRKVRLHPAPSTAISKRGDKPTRNLSGVGGRVRLTWPSRTTRSGQAHDRACLRGLFDGERGLERAR